jgi:hypothetical protein
MKALSRAAPGAALGAQAMIHYVFTHGNCDFSQSWFEVKNRHPASILRPFHQLRQLGDIFLRAR